MFVKPPSENRAVALIMAVAIMAVLAVVGFGFASSMKLEYAATSAIKSRTQARLAAYAALQLFQGALATDSTATASATAGNVADHFSEDLYVQGIPTAQQTLLEPGTWSVRAEMAEQLYYTEEGSSTVKVRDESSKVNLNAHGNLSKWYAGNFPNSKTAADISDAAASVYHGVNHRFSSFEVSLEELFYYFYTKGELWNASWPEASRLTSDSGDPAYAADSKEARIRCANLARAICLWRYGSDGKPGKPGVDDDGDNDYLSTDDVDNDGDGTNNEDELGGDSIADEGIDEPDEFNPDRLVADSNDRKYTAVAQTKEAFVASYTISSTNVPAAVAYAGDADAQNTEADRLYNLVRTELTVDSYTLDILSASIDPLNMDGYDNDGDGEVDSDDNTGAKTIAELRTQIDAGKTIYGEYDAATDTFDNRIDVQEKSPSDPAEQVEHKKMQAAYLYLKLKDLVPQFTLKNALDIVDYRDTGYEPTVIAQADVNALTGGDINEDLYGMEGLHVTEIGRHINVTNQFGSENAPWAGTGTVTYTVDHAHVAEADRTSVLAATDATNLKQGDYLIKVIVTIPNNGKLILANADGSLTKEFTASGETVYFGPVTVDGSGKGTFRAIATHLDTQAWTDVAEGSQFQVADIQVLMPYIEVMNWSKRPIDMRDVYVYVGPKLPGAVTDADVCQLTAANFVHTQHPAHGITLDDYHVAGHTKMPTGFTATHGAGYGYFLIAYDQESFAQQFTGGGDGDGVWGDSPGEDFPLWVVSTGSGGGSEYMNRDSNPFYDAFNGQQQVQLLTRQAANTYTLVAGGVLDGMTAATGTTLALNSANLAVDRYFLFGNPWYSKSLVFPYAKWTRDVDAATSPRVSPGRWNRISDAYSNGWWLYNTTDVSGATHGRHDIPVIADRGYFISSTEVSNVSAGEHKNATFTYEPGGGQHDDLFPDWNRLIAFTVAGRTPARINLNTASAPVMAAAAVGLTPDAATLIAIRDFNALHQAQILCEATHILNVYYNDAAPAYDDDDDDNVKRDFGERTLWLTKTGSIFTLRGHAFTVACSGTVRDGSGRLRASYALDVLFDRGRAVVKDGDTYKPVIQAVVRN